MGAAGWGGGGAAAAALAVLGGAERHQAAAGGRLLVWAHPRVHQEQPCTACWRVRAAPAIALACCRPRAAAATASWCGDRCCCRYGPLRQLCGRDLRALAAPARCPEAALPARHSRQRRRHRRLIAPSAGWPAGRARGQLESREPEIRGKSPRVRVREAGGGRGGGRGRPKRYLAATGRPCCLPPAQGHSGGPISPPSGGQKSGLLRFFAPALDVICGSATVAGCRTDACM